MNLKKEDLEITKKISIETSINMIGSNDHSFNGILNDFKNYFPLVNKGGYIIFDDYLPYKIGSKERDAPNAINKIIKENKDKIIDIGLIDDIVEIYKLKHGNIFNGMNIDYIIKKI